MTGTGKAQLGRNFADQGRRPMVAPGQPEIVVTSVLCAAGPGMKTLGNCGPRSVTGLSPATGAGNSAFALPRPLISSQVLTSLPRLNYFRGTDTLTCASARRIQRSREDQIVTAQCQFRIASARKVRSVDREIR